MPATRTRGAHVERDQADVRDAVNDIRLGADRHQGGDEIRVDRPVQEGKIGPALVEQHPSGQRRSDRRHTVVHILSVSSAAIHNAVGCRDIADAEAHHGDMTAIAWSLVGLMAASLGVLSTALFAMFGKFDALESRIDARFSSFEARMDGRFNAIDARFDDANQRLNAQTAEIRADLRVFDERLRSVGG